MICMHKDFILICVAKKEKKQTENGHTICVIGLDGKCDFAVPFCIRRQLDKATFGCFLWKWKTFKWSCKRVKVISRRVQLGKGWNRRELTAMRRL